MADNRGVAYMSPGTVEVHNIDFPTFELKDGPGVNPANVGRPLPHAAILKVVSTNNLRLRSAHGAWAHDGARGPDPRT
jgi:glutathione-independent formaldehyde dehydrogenase